jgi:hypothetical protein
MTQKFAFLEVNRSDFLPVFQKYGTEFRIFENAIFGTEKSRLTAAGF